jgi:hypothetical protein
MTNMFLDHPFLLAMCLFLFLMAVVDSCFRLAVLTGVTRRQQGLMLRLIPASSAPSPSRSSALALRRMRVLACGTDSSVET